MGAVDFSNNPVAKRAIDSHLHLTKVCNGAVMLLLKSRSAAIRDGDEIVANIEISKSDSIKDKDRKSEPYYHNAHGLIKLVEAIHARRLNYSTLVQMFCPA